MELKKALQAALKIDLPYSTRQSLALDPEAKQAAVMALWGFLPENTPALLLTKRTETVEKHKGQIAFPGGAIDEGESALAAALRETEEETGVEAHQIEVLGTLPEIFIPPTRFTVTPYVGLLKSPIQSLALKMNPHEILWAEWFSLGELLDPANFAMEEYRFGDDAWKMPAYHIHGHRIWGATAAMIKNLFDRMQPSLSR